MACEPITVRCGCGATIQCQHDAEADAAFPLLAQPDALEREVAAAIAALDQREAAIKELGGRFLGEALARRKQYLEQSITWCPGCGEPVRVEFLLKRPMIALTEVADGKVHWCRAMPIAPAAIEQLRPKDFRPTPAPPAGPAPLWETYDQ